MTGLLSFCDFQFKSYRNVKICTFCICDFFFFLPSQNRRRNCVFGLASPKVPISYPKVKLGILSRFQIFSRCENYFCTLSGPKTTKIWPPNLPYRQKIAILGNFGVYLGVFHPKWLKIAIFGLYGRFGGHILVVLGPERVQK